MFLPNLSSLERRLDDNSALLRELLLQLKELNRNVVRQNDLLQNKYIEQTTQVIVR